MADELKPDSPSSNPPSSTPAPDTPNAAPDAGPSPDQAKSSPSSTMPADPLSDGTAPTILETGSSHQSVPKNRASITSIYRKADIMTTLITLVVALVTAAGAVGVYAYLTRSKTPTTSQAPSVTTLDKGELEKLGSFFEGNSAGTSAQVLTISASSLFKNRVAVSSDLKVTGNTQVTGTTALADLTVDKNSTLGITSVRGQLTVAGPTSFQGPVQLGSGGSINGNLAVSGNGTYAGSVSAATLNVRDLSVSGTLNLNGHVSIGGQDPSASAVAGVSTSAGVDGNDAAGTITITVPPHVAADSAQLVTVTFRSAYPRAPRVIITPIGAAAARLQPFVLKTATNFTIGAASFPASANATSYSFDYWVVQ